MCIGMHLALAEMALVPAIYRRYSSRIKHGFEDVTPGITSRFEVFYDETIERMEVSQVGIRWLLQRLIGFVRNTLAGYSSSIYQRSSDVDVLCFCNDFDYSIPRTDRETI